MEKSTEQDLKKFSNKEILELKEMTDILFAFYDNEMKACAGNYGVEDEELYKKAQKEVLKYLRFREKIFGEIKERIDGIL